MSILKENDLVSIKSLKYTFGDVSLLKLDIPIINNNFTYTIKTIVDTNAQWIDSNNSKGYILHNSPYVWNELDLVKINK